MFYLEAPATPPPSISESGCIRLTWTRRPWLQVSAEPSRELQQFPFLANTSPLRFFWDGGGLILNAMSFPIMCSCDIYPPFYDEFIKIEAMIACWESVVQSHYTGCVSACLRRPRHSHLHIFLFPLNRGRKDAKLCCELSVDTSDKVPVSMLCRLAAAFSLDSETLFLIIPYRCHTLDI